MQYLKKSPDAEQESAVRDLAAGDSYVGSAARAAVGGVKTQSAVENPVLENGFYYSDTLPVRVIAVANFQSRAEQGMSPPYSPLYLSYLGRLGDPAQTGVLGATIRGPNVRDSTAMTALAKAISRSPGTVYEIAPIVRSTCALLSLCADNYELDPIMLRFVRSVNMNNRTSSIHIIQKDDFPSSPMLVTAKSLPNLTNFLSTSNLLISNSFTPTLCLHVLTILSPSRHLSHHSLLCLSPNHSLNPLLISLTFAHALTLPSLQALSPDFT
ncbi:hypothetical protein M0802_014482 [Mischocyttarus mexicanus]|nr:hypothetical protein M0802_014482 [Mischocyttarus mexicanus]